MTNINLHLHTNMSDGVLSPIELLKKLEEVGIKIAAITDHDTIGAHSALRNVNIKDYYNGEIITGVEIKCTHQGYSIEILGFFIDVDYLETYLDNKKKKIFEFQKYAFEKGKAVSRELGLKLDDDSLKPGEYAGTALFNLLNKYYDYNVTILGTGIIENSSIFYRKTFVNPDSPFFVSEESLGFIAKDTVDKIHEAGGLAFLAHPGQYKMISDKLEFLKSICSETSLDGIECYYSLHTPEETQSYIEFCKANNLLISGGSDYHGTPSQNIICQDNIDPDNLEWIKTYKKNK